MKLSRKSGMFIAITFVLLIAVIVLSREPAKAPPPAFFDSRKAIAYTNLLAAVKELAGTPPDTNAASWVVMNLGVFNAVARAVKEPVESPATKYEAVTTAFLDDLPFFKGFSRALVAKARVAEDNGRFEEAADAYLDSFRLAQNVEHGPLISFLVGSAMELWTLTTLESRLTNLPPATLRRLAIQMEDLNKQRISIEGVLEREEYFMEHNAKNILDLMRSRYSPAIRSQIASTKKKHTNLRAKFEICAASVATLAYTHEMRKLPSDLKTLVGRYLNESPIDPYSGTQLKYLTKPRLVIYSVGPNGKDEQAKGDDITCGHVDPTWLEGLTTGIPNAR